MCSSADWDTLPAMGTELSAREHAAARHAAEPTAGGRGWSLPLSWDCERKPKKAPRTQPMVKLGPTPRISCEARLNEEKAT